MKQNHIFLLLISLILISPSIFAQLDQMEEVVDFEEKYGLRLGVDITKPARTFIEDEYQGFEIKGDFRLYEDYYLAGELGNEQNAISEENVSSFAKGSYIKLGVNYNVYENWRGMQNLIFVGLRYGFATFSTELRDFAIYNRNSYFERDLRTESQEFKNLTASWAEFQLGIKVEVLANLFLGTHVQLKRRITETEPTNFDNLYIPGFNRTYDRSTYGVGYGYSISYLIPFYKRD